ncbi:MAG TPA: hypothetical protein VI911_04030 [Patescibacteria group bacterium]|nr:hypothetical protein [Patescibacteria group bacterium]
MPCITTKSIKKKKVRVIVLENGRNRFVQVVESPQKAKELERKLSKENKNLKFEFKFIEDER